MKSKLQTYKAILESPLRKSCTVSPWGLSSCDERASSSWAQQLTLTKAWRHSKAHLQKKMVYYCAWATAWLAFLNGAWIYQPHDNKPL